MYGSIVMGTDGSPTANAAVEHATGLAQASGAELHVVFARRPELLAVDLSGMTPPPPDSTMADETAEAILADAATQASASDLPSNRPSPAQRGASMPARQTSVRPLAAAGIAGAVITVVGALVVQFGVKPGSDVSDDVWHYPFSAAGHVTATLVWSVSHLLVAAGLVGVRSSTMTGGSLAGRRGISIALAGTGVLLLAEFGSIAVRNAQVEDASTIPVVLLFAVGTITSAVGLITAGRAARATGSWAGWQRSVAVWAGVSALPIPPLAATTTAVDLGIATYGLGLLALFVALARQPEPTGVVPAPVLQPA